MHWDRLLHLAYLQVFVFVHPDDNRVAAVYTRSPAQLLVRPTTDLTMLVRVVAKSLVAVQGGDALHIFRVQVDELCFADVRSHEKGGGWL